MVKKQPIEQDSTIPTKEMVRIYYDQRNMTVSEADMFYSFQTVRNWKTKKGTSIITWKMYALQNIRSILKNMPWRLDRTIH